jgi:hypothetical protein
MNIRMVLLTGLFSIGLLPSTCFPMEDVADPVSINRLNDSEILVQKFVVAATIHKSEKLRSVVNGIAYVAVATALVSAGYRIFATASPILPNAKALTQEKAYELFTDLYRQVRPPIFSWDWIKNIMFNPITVLEMTVLGVKKGYNFMQDKLYAPDVAWMLEHKTRLGTLVQKGIGASEHLEFEPGLLFNELERSAIILDSAAQPRSLLPVDEPYEREHLIETMNNLVEDLTNFFGFLDYLTEWKNNQSFSTRVTQASVYLKQCLTSFSETLEARLNHEVNDTYKPLVDEFVAEVKQSILRFV